MSHSIVKSVCCLHQAFSRSKTKCTIWQTEQHGEDTRGRNFKYVPPPHFPAAIGYAIKVSVCGSYQAATRFTTGDVVIKMLEDCKITCWCHFKDISVSTGATATGHSIKVTISA